MCEVLEKFDFDNTIAKRKEAGALFLVMERFKNVDLHPDPVSNIQMGYIFLVQPYMEGDYRLEAIRNCIVGRNHNNIEILSEEKDPKY